jgi:hypothetical protein
MVLCSFCDGVPLKFKKKNGRASSLRGRILRLGIIYFSSIKMNNIDNDTRTDNLSLVLTLLRILWTIPLSRLIPIPLIDNFDQGCGAGAGRSRPEPKLLAGARIKFRLRLPAPGETKSKRLFRQYGSGGQVTFKK